VTELEADERARRGLFLAFQYPHAIPGVTVTSFLRSAINAIAKARNDGEDDPVKIKDFRQDMLAAMEKLKVPRELAQRYLNDGFSGGEKKKRVEILQMAMLKPRMAVLDETDSGLDIDALKTVAQGVRRAGRARRPARLLITHYQRILNYVKPDFVHVFVDGRIVQEGGPELAHKLEAEGYEGFAANGEEQWQQRLKPKSSPAFASDYKYGFHEIEDYFFKSGRGLSAELVAAISEHKNEPVLDAQVPAQVARVLHGAPDAGMGRRPHRDRLRQHLLLHPPDREAGELLGGPAAPRSRTPGTSSASPRRRRTTSPGSAPSTSPRSSTTSSRRTSRTRA